MAEMAIATHELGVCMDHLSDALASEGFLPEPPLDIVQDLGVGRVVLIQEILELKIGRPKAIAEVLCEDPATI